MPPEGHASLIEDLLFALFRCVPFARAVETDAIAECMSTLMLETNPRTVLSHTPTPRMYM